jgi:hypothetical protein
LLLECETLPQDPETTALLPQTLLDPSAHVKGGWGPKNVNTMKLISLVRNLDDNRMKSICLAVLSDLAEYEDLEGGVTREMSQNRMDKLGEYSHRKFVGKTFGATTLMLNMLCDLSHDDALQEILDLGNALLLDGNRSVQDRIYQYFIQDSAGTFFERIRDLIRRGCEEIKERKAYHQRVQEIIEASDGLDPDDVKESLPVFHERAHILRLLRFIQLTCEGHNSKLQNYWRVQEHSVRSYDIVTEISIYLVDLCTSGVSGDNIEQMTQCIETLTELMQGPCKGNQITLSSSKLPATCNKILIMRQFPGCESGQRLQLHESTANTLLALLEGCRSKVVPSNIANEFDFQNLFDILEESQAALVPGAENVDADAKDKLDMAFAIVGFLMTIREFGSSFH